MHAISRRGWIGLLAVVAATSAVTATATTALANHQFNDVPTGSFFHDEIAAIFDAGCASGFEGGEFRPGDPTTRGQFTFWLNNCGGRVALGNNGMKVLATNAEQILGTAEMTAGALPSGGGFVVALASAQASTSDCAVSPPCVIEFRLKKNAAIVETFSLALTEQSPDSGSMQAVFPVGGGSDTTVQLAAAGNLGTNTVLADGSVTLLYVPFAGDGTGGGQEDAPG
jgi:hypothetical protein